MMKRFIVSGMMLLASVTVFAQESPKIPNLKKLPAKQHLLKTKTMIIGPKRLQCIGIMQTGDCYQVKQDKSQKEWESFPYPIEGFKHKPGYQYVISVKVVPSKVVLEGATEEYVYLKTISKTKVK
ncbi:DUF4377 domain-containing protein [Chryseobacterium sp. IHB B 17019]|jgi:hypothetical protein|uniref:DUF4377 domain-containing protein n=1 Tax=Chryseobacterium sp. IHB B 17019 TaxID=1721091 RepID=UPI0009EC836A|nr:DUF4377 domain-containing protein [Chryseobacterium sp. IHB B 17019]